MQKVICGVRSGDIRVLKEEHAGASVLPTSVSVSYFSSGTQIPSELSGDSEGPSPRASKKFWDRAGGQQDLKSTSTEAHGQLSQQQLG